MKKIDQNDFTYILNAKTYGYFKMRFMSPSVRINMNALLACNGCLQNAIFMGLINCVSALPHMTSCYSD
jgi:hypothetical protein